MSARFRHLGDAMSASVNEHGWVRNGPSKAGFAALALLLLTFRAGANPEPVPPNSPEGTDPLTNCRPPYWLFWEFRVISERGEFHPDDLLPIDFILGIGLTWNTAIIPANCDFPGGAGGPDPGNCPNGQCCGNGSGPPSGGGPPNPLPTAG